jgi:predicted MFS family arabinose efflux permease
MIAGLIGLAASTVTFAHAGSFGALAAARACQGAAAALSWTGGLTLVASTHAPEKRGAALGAALGATGIGTLLGPPLGGWLFQLGGARLPFLVAAALALLGALACGALIRPRPYPRSDTSTREVLRTPGIGAALLVTAAGAAIIAALEPILPLRMASELGASPPLVGAIFGAATLASTVAFPLAGQLGARWPARSVIGAGALLAAIGLLVLAPPPTIPLCAAGLCTVAVGNALILAPTSAVMSRVAESHRPPAYGTTYALYTIAYSVGLALGPLLSAVAVAQLGWRPSLIAGAALLGAAAAGLFLRRSRA